MTNLPLPRCLGLVIGAAALAVAAPPAVRAAEVVLTRLDGTTVGGTLEDLSDSAVSLSLSSPPADAGTAGEAVQIPWDELTGLAFMPGTAPAPNGPPKAAAAFHFAGGGTLHGEIVAGAPDAVVAFNPQTGELVIPFAGLEAVTFARAEGAVDQADKLLEAARAERVAGQDVLVAADGDEAKAVRGAITQLGPESSAFLFNARDRRIETARIFGIVFALGTKSAAAPTMLLRLQSGDAVPGTPATDGFASETLRFATSFGRTLELPVASVAGIEVRNPRIVPLAALEPQSVETRGLVHEPWPWRRDRSVGNTPLAMAGRQFERGLGVHACTVLVYALDGAYETFAATVGIDDAVRPRGAVEFSVEVDGRPAWTSGILRGADRPRNVIVPIEKARTLTLRVDFGPGGDIADWADWADARLIKPAAKSQAKP